MHKNLFPFALIVFIVLIMLTGCSSSISSSSSRFTHVDVDGPAPFVFFDQETKQVCWGLGESAKGSKTTVTIKVKPSGDPVEISMPFCKNLK
ncbi:MAG: hypothetical protein ABSE92_10630 [Terriglobales bacterium]|jgi:uncharacterized protein YceK